MNLIDAIKSGRPFRKRKRNEEGYGWLNARGDGYDFTAQEILSDDWEVKPAEPVVFDTHVHITGFIAIEDLKQFAGRKIRVTIEELTKPAVIDTAELTEEEREMLDDA